MRLFVYLALGFVSLVVAIVAWALAEPYWIDTERHDVEIPDLPGAWDGRKVALIADLQVGMWLGNTSTIRRIVRRIVREAPDVAAASTWP